MAFLLDKVVPWGRTRKEYMKMFSLTETDLCKKIASFGDGPASFNYESTISGHSIISLDVIYQFTKEQIESQIYKTKDIVVQQMQENMQNYIWTDIKDIADLEKTRMGAMQLFLNDFDGVREVSTKVIFDFIYKAMSCEIRGSNENSESAWFPQDQVLNMIKAQSNAERYKSFLEYKGRPIYIEYVTKPEFQLNGKRCF